MEFIFKRPELEDKDLVNKYLRLQKSRSCECTFSNIYLWSRYYKVTFAVIEDMLVFQSNAKEPSFVCPLGRREGVKPAIDVLMEYCKEHGFEFKMHNVTEKQFAVIEEYYPGRFQIEYDRDIADYIYESEKLIALSGRKYHSKKNHVNKFRATYADWRYESISKDNLEDCFQMALQWRRDNGCEEDEDKGAEICVTLNALRLFEELELKGGLIRINGEVVAFTIGEEVRDDTFVVHIEKAHAHIQGAYPMINQQFILHEGKDYPYINREEDMGSEGLRRAKLSYRPVFLIEKGIVTIK